MNWLSLVGQNQLIHLIFIKVFSSNFSKSSSVWVNFSLQEKLLIFFLLWRSLSAKDFNLNNEENEQLSFYQVTYKYLLCFYNDIA